MSEKIFAVKEVFLDFTYKYDIFDVATSLGMSVDHRLVPLVLYRPYY